MVNAYIGYISKHNNGYIDRGFRIHSGEWFSFNSLTIDDLLLLVQRRVENVTFASAKNHGGVNGHIDLTGIKNTIHPNLSLNERVASIRDKSNLVVIKNELSDLEAEKLQITSMPLPNLLNSYPNELSNIIEEHCSKNKLVLSRYNLFRFLLLSGYLNEDYYNYTSIFRENESWSRIDQKYYMLLRIREDDNFFFDLDNPERVFNRLTVKDFDSVLILNPSLVEFIVQCIDEVDSKFKALFLHVRRLLSRVNNKEHNKLQEFWSLFFKRTECLKSFFGHLISEWESILSAPLLNEKNLIFIQNLLIFGEWKVIQDSPLHDPLKKKLENHLHLYFGYENNKEEPGNLKSNLKKLLDNVVDIGSLKPNQDLYKFVIESGLYEINAENLLNVIDYYGIEKKLGQTQSYKAVLLAKNAILKTKVDEHINEFIDDVSHSFDKYSEQDDQVVTELLNKENINYGSATTVISKMGVKFDSFDGIPKEYWSFILTVKKVRASWSNLEDYFALQNRKGDDEELDAKLFNRSALLEYLDDSEIATTLAHPHSNKLTKKLAIFVLNLNEISDENYIKLNKGVNYFWTNFPDKLSLEKRRLLAQNKLIELNEESFEEANGEYEKHVLVELVLSQPDKFLKDLEKYDEKVDGTDAAKLLKSTASENFKVKFCAILNDDILAAADIENIAAPYFLKLDIELCKPNALERMVFAVKDSHISTEIFLKYLHIKGKDEGLKLINQKFESKMNLWRDADVYRALAAVSAEYAALSVPGKRPKIDYTEENLELVKNLEKNDLISSHKINGVLIRVVNKKKFF